MYVCAEEAAVRLLTQPSPADLARGHRSKFPLRFDLFQDPFVQRRRRLSLRLQLTS